MLSSDPQLEVVGAVPNGRLALARIPQLNPDLVTLDVEMPEMDGLETLAEIRKIYPLLPIIMFSTLTERGASQTLEALSLGANDYVTKPANVGSVSVAMERIRQELIPRIKTFCSRSVGIEARLSAPRPIASHAQPLVPRAPSEPSRVDIVTIGVSTGGPNTLAEIFPEIPADFPVPIVLVQHMPPVFTKILAERLESVSRIHIREGQPGDILRPGTAWIAPGDYHMVLERSGGDVRIRTNQRPPENSCRPAVDVLFRSVAEIYRGNVLGVVLTGMGSDGLIGSERIREAGGMIFAQDEATSVVWGMPAAVAKAGLAHKILPRDQIGIEIARAVRKKRMARSA